MKRIVDYMLRKSDSKGDIMQTAETNEIIEIEVIELTDTAYSCCHFTL